MNWLNYPNFSEKEFACRYTNECKMRPYFLDMLQDARKILGFPLIITSGYRSPLHPVEAAKAEPGEHSFGVAADIAIHGPRALELINTAYSLGVRRIGVAQKGPKESRFIHVGMGDKELDFPPSMWSY